jgi:ribosomal protein L16 Arg81 hydroxylase
LATRPSAFVTSGPSNATRRVNADGPDMEIELKPGQILVLPRGWVHHPHALNQAEDSVRLTFVIRERR